MTVPEGIFSQFLVQSQSLTTQPTIAAAIAAAAAAIAAAAAAIAAAAAALNTRS